MNEFRWREKSLEEDTRLLIKVKTDLGYVVVATIDRQPCSFMIVAFERTEFAA